MSRKGNIKPCSAVQDDSVDNAACVTTGTGGYGLCRTHKRAWERAHDERRCDYPSCSNFLYRPGRTKPASRSLILYGTKYRRCNEHFHELLFYDSIIQERNLEQLAMLVHPGESGCWEWSKAYKRNPRYGEFLPYGADKDEGNEWLAHKVAYGWFVGGYGKDHQIDHRCKNGLCIRPDHLQAVTERENRKRRGKNPMRPFKVHRTDEVIQFAKEHGLPI